MKLFIEHDEPAIVSFGWADFPVVVDRDDLFAEAYHEIRTLPEKNKKSSFTSQHFREEEEDEDTPSLVESDDSDDIPSSSVIASVDADAIAMSLTATSSSSSVQFSTIHIQEYAQVLGDHPMPDSFPLSLDWQHAQERIQSVDEFEAQRQPRPAGFHMPRRLPALERRYRLEIVTGLSSTELNEQDDYRQKRLQQEGYRPSDVTWKHAGYVHQLKQSHTMYDLDKLILGFDEWIAA